MAGSARELPEPEHLRKEISVSWNFETEEAFQRELDWVEQFVRDEVEPLDHVLGSPYDIADPRFERLVRPLLGLGCAYIRTPD